jgi:hypothetical protein
MADFTARPKPPAFLHQNNERHAADPASGNQENQPDRTHRNLRWRPFTFWYQPRGFLPPSA